MPSSGKVCQKGSAVGTQVVFNSIPNHVASWLNNLADPNLTAGSLMKR